MDGRALGHARVLAEIRFEGVAAPSPVRTLVCILKKKNSSTGSYRDQHNQPVEVESEVWRVTVLGLPERSVHACREFQPDFPNHITSNYLTASGPAWEWLSSVVAAE